jgi:cobalamin-dependent methionine synthase I
MNGIILIGETLNSTRPSVRRVFAERDESAFLSLARAQIDGGASILDLNASMLMEGERDALRWGCRIVREKLRLPVMIDSPDAAVLAELAAEFDSEVIVNSFTADRRILDETLPTVSRAGAGAVVMLKDSRGIPPSVRGRMELAERAVAQASKHGIMPGRLFIDPVFTPLATSPNGLIATLECAAMLAQRFPAHQRIGGLSNVSYGLPERRLVNRTFAAMAVSHGMTALICDTTDRELIKALRASEALAGVDPNCRRFLHSYRKERESR